MDLTKISCLVDFGLPPEDIINGLTALAELKQACSKI
jgi:hypothetical protein